MEKNIKMELMKSVDSIKSKLKQMKNHEHKINLSLDKMLKPVTEPLKTLVNSKNDENILFATSEKNEADKNNINSPINCNNFYDADSDSIEIPKDKVEDLETSLECDDIYDIQDSLNIPFGIRKDNKTLMMGNSVVTFSKIDNLNNDMMYLIKIGDKSYNLTPGLKELLLRKKPDLKSISSKDKLVYKDILYHTNAHKRDFNPAGQIRGDKGTKYREIIKPLFSKDTNEKLQTKLGGSIPKLKTYKTNTDLVYWDDPNELVERLKLLVASRDAGNTNHDNEILSIIEELKEAGIIKE